MTTEKIPPEENKNGKSNIKIAQSSEWKKKKEIKKHHDDGNMKYAVNFTSLFFFPDSLCFFFGAYKTLVATAGWKL